MNTYVNKNNLSTRKINLFDVKNVFVKNKFEYVYTKDIGINMYKFTIVYATYQMEYKHCFVCVETLCFKHIFIDKNNVTFMI